MGFQQTRNLTLSQSPYTSKIILYNIRVGTLTRRLFCEKYRSDSEHCKFYSCINFESCCRMSCISVPQYKEPHHPLFMYSCREDTGPLFTQAQKTIQVFLPASHDKSLVDASMIPVDIGYNKMCFQECIRQYVQNSFHRYRKNTQVHGKLFWR